MTNDELKTPAPPQVRVTNGFQPNYRRKWGVISLRISHDLSHIFSHDLSWVRGVAMTNDLLANNCKK